MRRAELQPPNELVPEAAFRGSRWRRPLRFGAITDLEPRRSGREVAERAGERAALHLRPLGPKRPPDPRRRRFFDPKAGWFRRLERQVNKFLSRRVFPRVPGLERPYGWMLDRWLTVSHGDIALEGLGGEESGVRVLVISDLHAGPFVSPEAIARALDRLMTLRPDLILLAGDFATICLEEVEPIAPALGRLQAPLGVFGVLGNHDHYTGEAEALCRLLQTSGVELLQNRSVRIGGHSAGFRLAGVDDLVEGRPRLDRALSAEPGSLPTVLLSHNPDVFPEAVRRGVSLVVAGHTHGGQVRIPGLGVLVRMSRFRLDEGRYVAGASQLVVTRGLGVTGLPLRLACPPEALLLTLRPR